MDKSESRLRLSPTGPALLLALLALVPTLTVTLAFVLHLKTEPVYFLGKVILLIAPLIWIRKERWSRQVIVERWGLRRESGDILWGIGTGAGIACIVGILYPLVFRNRLDAAGIIATLPPLLLEHFWIAALSVSFGNSFLEEFFWRAFFLDQSIRRMGPWPSIGLNGLLFGLHHLLLLQGFFPGGAAWLFAFGTVAGGWIWSYMRVRGLSIWSCWISHALVDLAVMIAGYYILGTT